MVFKGIAARWKEARAPVIQKDALDILNRYNRWDDYERYECLSAFDYTKRDLESDHGPIAQWPTDFAKQISEQLMKAAKQGYNSAPNGASGAALLSFLVELHHVPGALSQELISTIMQWHKTAMQNDMSSRGDWNDD